MEPLPARRLPRPRGLGPREAMGCVFPFPAAMFGVSGAKTGGYETGDPPLGIQPKDLIRFVLPKGMASCRFAQVVTDGSPLGPSPLLIWQNRTASFDIIGPYDLVGDLALFGPLEAAGGEDLFDRTDDGTARGVAQLLEKRISGTRPLRFDETSRGHYQEGEKRKFVWPRRLEASLFRSGLFSWRR